MKFRGYASAFPLMALLLIGLMAVSVAASPVINTMDVNADSKSLQAGETVSFEWVIYNNDTHPCEVQISIDNTSGDGWSTKIDQDHFSLTQNTEKDILVQVESTRNAPSQYGGMTVTITVTQLDDLSQVTVITKTVTFHINSLFGSSGQNKLMGFWDNNLSAPFDSNWAAFGISVLGWIIVALAYVYVVEPIVHLMTKKTETDLDDLMLEALRVPVFLLIILFGLVNSLEVLTIPNDYMQLIQQVYHIVFIILVTWMVYRVFNDVIIHAIGQAASKTDTEIDDVLVPLLHKIGMLVIPLVAVIIIFKDDLGIDPTILIASMGVIGIVIGYAAQSSLSNLFSGLQLLIDRPFKIGDIVEIDSGEICEVKHIGLRTTTLYNTSDHETIVLPNNDVANKKVVNYTRPNNHRVITAEVGVAYGTDVQAVKKILLDIAHGHPDVVNDNDQEKPYVRFTKFNDSSMDFKLAVWVDDVRKMWRVGSELREQIDLKFKEENIEIPFPQSVVTFKNGNNGNNGN